MSMIVVKSMEFVIISYQSSCPWMYGPHHPPPLLQVQSPRISGESMMSFNPFFRLGVISENPLITPSITVDIEFM